MSPKSRGRTPRNPSRRDQRRTAGGGQTSPGSRLLEELDAELRDADVLSAEVAASALLGATRLTDAEGRGRADLLVDVVRQAAKVHRPTSLGLLRCLAHLGGDDTPNLIADGIRRLTAAGVPEPAWVGALDDVAATGAWTLRDVYGDASTIGVESSRPGGPHALVVLVDNTQGGTAIGAFVDDDPDGARAERSRQAHDPLMVIEDLDLRTARARMEAAFAATDATRSADPDEDLLATRALAVARLRALPTAEGPPAAPLDPADRARLVADFLASPEAGGLGDTPVVERIARLLVDVRSETEPADPLRTGPGVLADLLLDRLPRADLSSDEAAVVPDLAVAWARFAARRQGLPAVATT